MFIFLYDDNVLSAKNTTVILNVCDIHQKTKITIVTLFKFSKDRIRMCINIELDGNRIRLYIYIYI